MKRRIWESPRGFGWPGVLGILLAVLVSTAGCMMVSAPPQASFTISPSTEGNAPLSLDFSAFSSTDPDNDIEMYQWDFGDGTQGSGMTVGHVYTAAGTYTVVLKVTDTAGNFDQISQTVIVRSQPTASFTAAPTAGNSPLAVWFDASASSYHLSPLTYEWDFGDGRLGSGRITTHQYSAFQGATYTVTLTVRGPDGASDTATRQITVLSPAGGGGGPCAL